MTQANCGTVTPHPLIGIRPRDAMRRGIRVCWLLLLLAACSPRQNGTFQGYAEGEFVRVASPFAGELTALHVQRGTQVAAGTPLFQLEREQDLAAQREAQQQVRTAQAQVENLSAARRPLEREAAQADLAQTESSLLLSKRDLQRDERLFRDGFIPESRLDASRQAFQRDTARVEQARAQSRLADQSVGRRQEVSGARAQLEAARAQLAQTDGRVQQKSQDAPQAALVYETFFVQGEWVPAGRPVVSLLPPGNIKVRFFVPETVVGAIKVGQRISVGCDGCGQAIAAGVSYVSPQPEYTPPVIYSREERAKLVFLVEARPDPAQAARLKPGQPLDVKLEL